MRNAAARTRRAATWRAAAVLALAMPAAAGCTDEEPVRADPGPPRAERRTVRSAPAGLPLVLPDGRPAVLAVDETSLRLIDLSEDQPVEGPALDLDAPVVDLVARVDRDRVVVAVERCEAPHDPNDQDLHDACDAGGSAVVVAFDPDGLTASEPRTVVGDEALVDLGLFHGRPVVQTAGGIHLAAPNGGFDRVGGTRDARNVCVTDGGLYGLPISMPSPTTTAATDGDGTGAAGAGTVLWADLDQPGPLTWRELAVPGVPDTVTCRPDTALVALRGRVVTPLVVLRASAPTSPVLLTDLPGAPTTAATQVGANGLVPFLRGTPGGPDQVTLVDPSADGPSAVSRADIGGGDDVDRHRALGAYVARTVDGGVVWVGPDGRTGWWWIDEQGG